jgi:hypothetical protein
MSATSSNDVLYVDQITHHNWKCKFQTTTRTYQIKILSKVLYPVNQTLSSMNCNQEQTNDCRTHTSSIHKYNDININTMQGANQQMIQQWFIHHTHQ